MEDTNNRYQHRQVILEKEYRYERKFCVSDMSRQAVEKAITLNNNNFRTLFPERQINNIYLDSHTLHCFHDNVDGVAHREKYRIRWYGDTYGQVKHPVLEKKIRINSAGTKEFWNLAPFEFSEGFSRDTLMKIIDKSDIPPKVKEALRVYSPSLVNGYSRKYYMSFDKKYRVTLDNELFYVKAKSKGVNPREKILDRKNTIVEIKYDVKNDEGVDLITRQLNFRLSKNSKYVSGIFHFHY